MYEIHAFLLSNTIMDKGSRIQSVDLYAAFKNWWPEYEDAPPITKGKVFTQCVTQLFSPWPEVVYGTHHFPAKGGATRGFRGLRLAEPGELGTFDLHPQLEAARTVIRSAEQRHDWLVEELAVVHDLLRTAEALQWSRATAAAVLEEYVDVISELSLAAELIRGYNPM